MNFHGSGLHDMNDKEKLIINQDPVEGIKVWILVGYPSNILELHFQEVIRTVPPFH